MPLFANPLMLAGLALAAAPVIIHLFFRMRRRRAVFPPLQFLRRTQTVQSSRLKLRDLILLLCRVLAVLCLALAFARPYFLGQELEAGVESGAVDLILLVDNSSSMSYKPDQVSRLDLAREMAERFIAQRQPGDRVGILEVTRPNDPVLRLQDALSRATAAVRSLPQRFTPDRPIAALVNACNSFSDDPEFKRTHRVVYLGDLQASRWSPTELQRQVAPLAERYRVELQVIDVAAASVNNANTGGGESTVSPASPTSANTCISRVEFNLAGYAPGQPAPVTVTVHRYDDKPVAVLPVQVNTLDSGAATPVLGSLNMAGSGDARITLQPLFAQAGWQAIRVEVQARDPLPADNLAYAVAPLTDRPAVLVIEGAADDADVREDETRGQAYFVAQALRVHLGDQSRDLEVKVAPPSGLTNLALAHHGGVVLCGVSSLSPAQIQALEQYTARGGQLLLFAARVKPGTPGKLAPPEDLTAVAFFNSAYYKNGLGLVGLRLDRVNSDTELSIASLRLWERDCDLFEPFAATENSDPTAFSLYARQAVNVADLQSLTARLPRRAPSATGAPSTGETETGADDPGASGARVLAAISPTEPFLLDRPFGQGRVLTVFGAARPEWTNWVRKRNFLPVLRQWSRRLQADNNTAETEKPTQRRTTPAALLNNRFDAGAQPTVAQVIGAPVSVPGAQDAAASPTRYFLQRPDPAAPFQTPSQTQALRTDNLTLESTLDLDTPGLYYLGAMAAAGTEESPLLLPVAVSIDPAEGVLTPAAPDTLLAAIAARSTAHPEQHTITAESTEVAKRSSRWWIWLAGGVAILLLLEQLIRDGRSWRSTAGGTHPMPPA